MIDEIVGGAISVGENKLHGEKSEEKTSFGGWLLRFVVSILWFVITAAVSIGAACVMAGQMVSDLFGGESNALGIMAIAASLTVAVLTFCIPFLRKKGSFTRWCGIICLGDAIWWIYLWITGFN